MNLASASVITLLALPLYALAGEGDKQNQSEVDGDVHKEVDMDPFEMEDWLEDDLVDPNGGEASPQQQSSW